MNYTAANIDGTYRIELIRKAIHLCSLWIPIFYFFTDKRTALLLFVPLTLCFIAVDITRHYNPTIESWFYKTWGWLLRGRETDKHKKRLNGATYVLIAATLSILFFPKLVAVTSFAVLIISDMSAALVGRRFGKRKFFSKSLEGSLAFFVSGLLVVLLAPKIEYLLVEYIIGVAAVAVGAVIESTSIEIDDNLSIPMSVGATMWLLYHFALPMVDVYKFG